VASHKLCLVFFEAGFSFSPVFPPKRIRAVKDGLSTFREVGSQWDMEPRPSPSIL
jgi:hypothetical protein